MCIRDRGGWLVASFCRLPLLFACGLYLILYKRCIYEQRPCQSAPAAMACLRRLGPYAAPTPTLRPNGPRLLLPAATQVRQTQLPLCHRSASRCLRPDPQRARQGPPLHGSQRTARPSPQVGRRISPVSARTRGPGPAACGTADPGGSDGRTTLAGLAAEEDNG